MMTALKVFGYTIVTVVAVGVFLAAVGLWAAMALVILG